MLIFYILYKIAYLLYNQDRIEKSDKKNHNLTWLLFVITSLSAISYFFHFLSTVFEDLYSAVKLLFLSYLDSVSDF